MLFRRADIATSSASVADGCYGSSGENEDFISIEMQLNECGKKKNGEWVGVLSVIAKCQGFARIPREARDRACT